MKLIGYTRVSTEEQGQEGHSLEEQAERINAYARCHPDIELVEIVKEVGSAKDMNRPGLLGLLHKMDNEGIDGVIVVQLDRLTRNLANLIQMVEHYFKPEGDSKNLISIMENLDLKDATGRMLVYFLAIFAQWQRERISEHSKRTAAHLKSQNKRFNAHPPYGLMVNPKDPVYLIACKPEQKVLKRIQTLRQEMGCSLSDIVKILPEEELFNRAGNPFNESAVSKLCRRNGWKPVSLEEEL